ncbi:MAG TPA: SMC-Scp complex subunit ScpB [Thermoanaerobacterales bacterium]|nr:SMC-Scp complex subunit ScpB [Thermoanaerobacterales bacterium]
MIEDNILSAIEALLFISNEPLTLDSIAEILEIDEEKTKEAILHLKREYEKNNSRGIQISEIAGGFRLSTKAKVNKYIEKLDSNKKEIFLSQAALETLAIILYKQPIPRANIEDIRGVNSEKSLKTLIERGLITELGRIDAPGRPIIYGTTKKCLEYLGLNSLDDLPKLETY